VINTIRALYLWMARVHDSNSVDAIDTPQRGRKETRLHSVKCHTGIRRQLFTIHNTTQFCKRQISPAIFLPCRKETSHNITIASCVLVTIDGVRVGNRI
jgi:hypothetical protein